MKKWQYVFYFIISYLFSCTLYLSSNISYKIEVIDKFIKDFKFNFSFFMYSLLIAIPIFIILIIFIKLIGKINITKSKKPWNIRKIRIVSFLSIYISSILYIVTFYPGSNMVDTLYIIFDPIYQSQQFPLVYSVILSTLYHFAENIFNSSNLAFFLLGILQSILMSGIISYVITWFHKTFKTNFGTLILILYFTFITVITSMNTVIIRDPLYSGFMLLLLPRLYEIIKSNGKLLKDEKYIVKLIIIISLMCLVRNNGVYVFILIFMILLIKFRKYLKNLLLLFFGVILIVNFPKLLPTSLNKEQLFKERAAVPIQQLAYLYKYDKLSREDEEYFSNLIQHESIEELYNPLKVDSLKWSIMFDDSYLNSTKVQFLKIWLKNLPINFESYVKAYLLSTFDLWSIQKFKSEQSVFMGLEFPTILLRNTFTELNNEELLPKKIQKILVEYYKTTAIYFNNASCFYICILVICIAIYKRRKDILFYSVPLISTWITLMIACPLSWAFRYMSCFAYLLPFIILLLFINNRIKIENNISK